MNVSIKLFGNLGHYLPEGGNRFSFTKKLDKETTAEEMVKELGIPEMTTVLIVVNGRRVTGEYALRDGDQISFFRPTSGG